MNEVDPNLIDIPADAEILDSLTSHPPKSFFLYAGAGSGKTRSLVQALVALRDKRGEELWMRGQRVGVITYTNKATDEIKRRLDFNALIEVSTIHSFAWSLLEGHTTDIRGWLEANLKDEIAELADLQARGRPASKAAKERERSIALKRMRLAHLPSVKRFVYSPTENKRGRDALAHTEVISCVSTLLRSKPSLQKILISKFPILFIDESQDTNRHLMDALLEVQQTHAGKFSIGLFGDTMQRIYADGKVGLETAIPPDWARPAKVMNHRSRERIVRLVNRIRATVDTQAQQWRSDRLGGIVRLFVVPQNGKDKGMIEENIAARMATITNDNQWTVRQARQTLILEHHMAARRLGFSDVFEPLYAIDRFRTGLLDGTLPPLRFLTGEVLPLVNALRAGKQFEAMAVLRKYCPLLLPNVLKEAGSKQREHLARIKADAAILTDLWKDGADPAIGLVLETISRSKLLAIPDALRPITDTQTEAPVVANDEEDEDAEAPRDEQIAAWTAVLKVSFSQIEAFARYLTGASAYDTHQGVKGLEFERVMVIIDDDDARGFMFSYDKLLGVKAKTDSDRKNESAGAETTLDRTRRLLYVICSRAEESLAVVAYTGNPAQVINAFVSQGLFERSEIETISA